MSAIEKFNPDALILQTGTISIRFFGWSDAQNGLGKERKIKLTRPNADFLWILNLSIKNRLIDSDRPETMKELNRSNYGTFILLIAARERMLCDDDARWAEEAFDIWKTGADMLLAELQLFRAVATLAAALNADTPSILRDEKKAWGQSILRGLESDINESQEDSINQYSTRLRNAAKVLSNGSNPFDDDDPELKLLIHYARMLSCHEESDPNHLKSLRKQVRQSLDRYRRSLLAEANFRQKDRRVCQTFVVNGQHYTRGIKNNIQKVPHTEPFYVSGGTPSKLSE